MCVPGHAVCNCCGPARLGAPRQFESDTRAFWTDGLALPGGIEAGAVVGFVEGYVELDPEKQRVVRERGGITGCGQRAKGSGERGREKL